LKGLFLGVCVECDIGLNQVALEFMGIPEADRILAEYAASKRAEQ
jgi:hypothetical protein